MSSARLHVGAESALRQCPALSASPAALKCHAPVETGDVQTRNSLPAEAYQVAFVDDKYAWGAKLDLHAAASYSWSSPPRRSRRLTCSG
jgi:hypothetical protein